MISRSSLLLAASLSLFPASTTLADRIPGDSILVGTVYNLFHEEYATDEEFFAQVDRDLPAMVAANIDTVLVFPMSEWDTATKQLKWRRTDYLVRAFEKHGLKFVPLMLKEEQASHYFPIWKYDELPKVGARHLSRSGGPNTRENVDFADPEVYPLVEEHFRQLITRYGKSPALSFYNIWNEPHYWSNADHVVARYREWLKKKYGDLAGLRRAWGEEYTDWSQVTPFLNDDWNSSMPRIDWTLFRSELPGELLRQLTDTVRKFDPSTPVNANPVGTAFGTYAELGGYTTDNWRFTPYNDFNGISYYPDGWDRSNAPSRHPLWLHNLNFNAVRSAAGEKGYLLTEIYTNAKNGLTLGGYVDKAGANQLTWLSLAHECRGLIFWKWEPFKRGRQSLGRGLVTLEGNLAPRGEAVKEFGAVIKKHGKLLRSAKLERPEVGLLFDAVGMLKAVEQDIDPRTRRFMHDSYAGVFRALDEANITADVLRTDLGVTLAQLKQYKVLFMPFQIVLRRDLAPVLTEYVRQGGCLIADARTATVDELDFAYNRSPGGGLNAVFGASRIDWVAREAKGLAPVTLDPASGAAGTFDGRFFREQLRLASDAQVFARFSDTGDPAIVARKEGNGFAVLSAVALGGSYWLEQDTDVKALLLALCEKADVRPPATFTASSGQSAMIRVHRVGDQRLIYVINPSETAQNGLLTLPSSGSAEAVDLLTDERFALRPDGTSASMDLSLAPLGVRCIWVR
ncbi:MAG: beta-galactosidase [Opitutaceae bacterium]|nr:beta-galactosidase [Opitutaceae bacterium]